MTIGELVPILPSAKQTKRGDWIALCLAHGDKTPSLSVREGTDGRILLHCWAGCTTSEIVAAMGLRLRDLFVDTKKDPAEIRREQERRERARAAVEAERKREGLKIDAKREADYFIQSRKGLDITAWSDLELADEMNSLADAYELLQGEQIHGTI